ncbi:hypothetical protein PRNP1_010680 [Phytophthora ramorum]
MLGGGHGGLQATRYAIQYATKQETVLDNTSVVELAFLRRIEREAAMATSKTELEQGLGRFMSLAYSSSSAMEVGGPLVTATLFEDGAAKFSCQFERLVVIEALNLMETRMSTPDSPEVDDEETANIFAVVDEAVTQMLLSNNVLGGMFPGDACGDVVVRQTPVKKAEVAAFENRLVSETVQTT